MSILEVGLWSRNKGYWQPDEDERLLQAVNAYGRSWGQVASEVGTRSRKQCTERYRQRFAPGVLIDYTFTEEDAHLIDQEVKKAQEKRGAKKLPWVAIAETVSVAIRARLPGNVMDPSAHVTDNQVKNCWNSRFRKNKKSATKGSVSTREVAAPGVKRRRADESLTAGLGAVASSTLSPSLGESLPASDAPPAKRARPMIPVHTPLPGSALLDFEALLPPQPEVLPSADLVVSETEGDAFWEEFLRPFSAEL